jgi:ketopantoate reductase
LRQLWARLQALEARMQAAGIVARLVDNINEELWEKFASILGFAGFTAATRRSIGPVLHDPLAESLLRRHGGMPTRTVGRAYGCATPYTVLSEPPDPHA